MRMVVVNVKKPVDGELNGNYRNDKESDLFFSNELYERI